MVGKKKRKEVTYISLTFFISVLIHLIIFFLIFGQTADRQLIIELSPKKSAIFSKEGAQHRENRFLKVSISKVNGEIKDKLFGVKIKDTRLRAAMLKLKKNST